MNYIYNTYSQVYMPGGKDKRILTIINIGKYMIKISFSLRVL